MAVAVPLKEAVVCRNGEMGLSLDWLAYDQPNDLQ